MIKFFRRIRQNLLTENKFSKYLLYAIGEIILVFIGIAMALQFNNWNEDKKTKEKERHALIEIISDLDLNISSLNAIIYTDSNSINTCINSINIIIKNLEQTKTYHDSLAIHFSYTFNYADLDLKSSGYESLASIGMDLISDNELRSEIGKFYTYNIPDVRAAYTETRDDFYHYMLDFLRTKFIQDRDGNDNRIRIPIDYESLKNDRVYIESLKAYIGVFEYYKEWSLHIIDAAKKLKKNIELNLKDNKF